MFLFLYSNCLTVTEVLVNIGIEPGPAFSEVCHCEGWSKSWCTNGKIFFYSIREWIDFWWCIDMMFATLRMRTFMRSVQYCTFTDFCWGGHEVLVNSKLHIDRHEAEVNVNCLLFNNTSCSLKQKSTIVVFYTRLKGLSCRSHNDKFRFESYLVANSRRHVFSWRC